MGALTGLKLKSYVEKNHLCQGCCCGSFPLWIPSLPFLAQSVLPSYQNQQKPTAVQIMENFEEIHFCNEGANGV